MDKQAQKVSLHLVKLYNIFYIYIILWLVYDIPPLVKYSKSLF
jgi:hypothetical protein